MEFTKRELEIIKASLKVTSTDTGKEDIDNEVSRLFHRMCKNEVLDVDFDFQPWTDFELEFDEFRLT